MSCLVIYLVQIFLMCSLRNRPVTNNVVVIVIVVGFVSDPY